MTAPKSDLMLNVALLAGLLTALSLSQLTILRAEAADHQPSKLQSVAKVDLNKYMGTWYEIASIPMFFQRMCTLNTQAMYTKLENGQVKVLNQCNKKDLKVTQVEGRAKVTNAPANSQLKVSFLNFFGNYQFWASGNYWVIDLASDYRYAVVGHPNRTYGWILSRNRVLSLEDLNTIRNNLKKHGYDTCRFQMTTQREFDGPIINLPENPTKLCDLKLP